MAEAAGPGRACPVGYRYEAKALQGTPALEAETLIVAGGLYGNPFALDSLLEAAAAEPGARLVFNGDFNWFDIDPADFLRVNETVLAHFATRGNVETELAVPAEGAGCGCGYPDWVGDAEVGRSNRIMESLRATAASHPRITARLGDLAMTATAEVGGKRIAIVHGDAGSLAGWGFSQEALATAGGLAAAGISCDAASADVIACSHTCLPVFQSVATARGEALVANNGAAGMPNFRSTRYGLATRVSVRPPRGETIYGWRDRDSSLFVHAIPVRFDFEAWESRFLAQWPPGSDAYLSYYHRICEGPAFSPSQANRATGQPVANAL